MAVNDIISGLRPDCVESLFKVADNVLQYLDEDKDEEYNKLRSYLEVYCRSNYQQNVEDEILEQVERHIPIENLHAFDNLVFNEISERTGGDISDHPDLVQFELKRRQHLLDADTNSEDVAITQVNTMNLDPLTKQPIRDPVKNSACVHVYERSSIISYMRSRSNGRNRPCPVNGCQKSLENIVEITVPHTNRSTASRRNRVTIEFFDSDESL